FSELRALVRPGDTLRISEVSGRKTSGRLGTLSPTSLELVSMSTDASGRTVAVPKAQLSPSDVAEIRVVRRDSLLNGTLIGLAAGAGPFLAVWPAAAGSEVEINVALGALVGGVAGAAIGAAVDASRHRQVTVFRAAPRAARLRIAPLVSPSTVGIRTAVRF